MSAKASVLLKLREQLLELQKQLLIDAQGPEFANIPELTEGTMFGLELAIKMLDANLAIVTGDVATLRAFLEGDDDSVGGIFKIDE